MLDKKDELIINALKLNSDLSTYQLAKRTSIPQTTVLNRIKKLKELGVIKRFTVELDYKKLGKKVKALIFTKVNKTAEKNSHGQIGSVEEKLFKHPQVLTIQRLMGEYDFVVEIIVEDIDELNAFLITKLRSLDYVTETKTIVVLDEWRK